MAKTKDYTVPGKVRDRGVPCPTCGRRYVWDWDQDMYRTVRGATASREIKPPRPGMTVGAVVKHFKLNLASGTVGLTNAGMKRDAKLGPVETVELLKCKCQTVLSAGVGGEEFGFFVYSCTAWKKVDWEDPKNTATAQ